jgi:cell division protein FtsW
MVYSASSARDLLAGDGNGSGYLERYAVAAAIGLVAMRFLSRRGLDLVRRCAPALLAVAFAGVLLVLIPGIGVEVNGARRWLGTPPVQVQPSELMKLALVAYAAHVLAARPERLQTIGGIVNPLLVVAGAGSVLVAVEPDLGTALIVAATLGCMLVAAGAPLRHLAAIAAVAVAAVVIFALLEPYRRARLTAFINPWADAGGTGFQSVQGQIALGSGGLLGLGLGQSVQKAFFLPEAHTDFILAVIGEELGVAGVCGVLFLYGMLAYGGLRAARAARGDYAKLLATGLTALILCQATINVFAVLGLAPLTGVPLPFISYGSSNLMVLLAAMGVLLNVAAGGSARLRAVPTQPVSHAPADRDRRRRDRRPRRARAGGRRRAAG